MMKLDKELATKITDVKNEELQLRRPRGEIKKLHEKSNLHSVVAEMVQKFYSLFSITSVMLSGILEYVRENSVRNPATVRCDINFVNFYTDSQAALLGYIIPIAVKLHFSDVFMMELSSIAGGSRRIVSKYQSDEKSTFLIFSVEYKSDETTVSTQFEAYKNFKKLKFKSFDYNVRKYKCFKKDGQSQLIITGPSLEYLYDHVEKVQHAASLQNVP